MILIFLFNMTINYIIGAPGTGKTSLLKGLVNIHSGIVIKDRPLFDYMQMPNDVYVLGNYISSYGGTDTIGYGANKHILQWFETLSSNSVVYGEGIRLTNGRFFDSCISMGYALQIIYLTCSGDELKDRYDKRNSRQNDAFIKGCNTIIEKTYKRHKNNVIAHIDTTGTTKKEVLSVVSMSL